MPQNCSEIIRKTLSTCIQCNKKVNADLVERGGKVYMLKKCPEHENPAVIVSNHAWYYLGLTDYYFSVMPKNMKQKRYYIYLSNKCNLSCPVCLLEPNQGNIPDIPLDQFKKVIAKNKNARFYLYGAEPTLRTDLRDWIKLLKKSRNMVNIHTNGIKLADYDYLKSLKDCGLDYVSIQFDGFDDSVYRQLRGRDLIDIKLKALNNLRKLNIATGLNVTIAKDVNENQINKIMDYAVKNRFIKDVSFATLSFLGNANKNFSPDTILMPDELIDIVEKEMQGSISRKNIFLFQKLYYAFLSVLNVRRCYNFQHLALVRQENEKFSTFDSVFKLDRFEKELDRYKKLVKKNKGIASLYFLLKFSLNFISENFVSRFKCLPFDMLFPGRLLNARIPSNLLLISFGTVCDYYKYDSKVSEYCGQGFCLEKDSKVELTDSISDYSLFYKKGLCE